MVSANGDSAFNFLAIEATYFSWYSNFVSESAAWFKWVSQADSVWWGIRGNPEGTFANPGLINATTTWCWCETFLGYDTNC